MKSIILYYSLSGKTELAAKAIAETTGGVLKKIEETGSRKGILGFFKSGRDAMKGRCSEIKPLDFTIDGYDVVFIGTPVWAFKPAPAINTMVSKLDFSGRRIVIFVTMGGSGAENTIKILTRAVIEKDGTVLDSFAIRTGGGVKDAQIIEKGREIGKKFTL